jgi:hypothetical protein
LGRWWTPGENPGSWVLSDLQPEADPRKEKQSQDNSIQGWPEMQFPVKDGVLRTLSLSTVTAGRTALHTNTHLVLWKTPRIQRGNLKLLTFKIFMRQGFSVSPRENSILKY